MSALLSSTDKQDFRSEKKSANLFRQKRQKADVGFSQGWRGGEREGVIRICWADIAFFITALLFKVLYSLYIGQMGINNIFVYVKFRKVYANTSQVETNFCCFGQNMLSSIPVRPGGFSISRWAFEKNTQQNISWQCHCIKASRRSCSWCHPEYPGVTRSPVVTEQFGS